MHLKSLTLKGFKSFASPTTLHFEPGITAVVGPNGSGKSNVVDALAWVMGEQGAKSLRGGKMEDVIFAGTAGRPPLGRAEVSLTIDNSDGALPIDYAEVTITRLMFRSGGSEYSINGTPCRLLDVQELLSDSGIGREMHVIVGQGQLEALLSADPQDRRGLIEEAAGVLKHRKRKEKALRKLEAMEANLTRITDLTAELRRQLKPLGRQAEVARRAAVVQADLRDARLRLLADDLVQQTTALEAEVADETALLARRDEAEAALSAQLARIEELEEAGRYDAPVLARAQETWYRLSSLRDRLRGSADLAAERVRLAEQTPAVSPSQRDPDELARQVGQAYAEVTGLRTQAEAATATLAQRVAERAAAEAAHAAEERAVADRLAASADRREGLARLLGQVNAQRSRVEAGEAELGRLSAAAAAAQVRAQAVRAEFARLETQVAGLEEGEQGLDAEHCAASAAAEAARARLAELAEAERTVERERAAWSARRDALGLSLARKDGAGTLLAASDRLSGLLGSVAALLRVEPGFETAVAAALGELADAVAVDCLASAVEALRALKDGDGGRAGLLLAGALPAGVAAEDPARRLAHLGRPAAELVEAPDELAGTLAGVLHDVLVVADLDDARAAVAADPRITAVTRAGDLLSQSWVRGGSTTAPSLLEVAAAAEEASARVAELTTAGQRLRFQSQAAGAELAEASARVEASLERLHASDARMAAVAEQLAQLGSTARSGAEEAERLAAAVAQAERALDEQREELARLTERLSAAEQSPEDPAPSTAERDRLAELARAARAAEMEARLALRTTEERLRACAARAEQLERAAEAERGAAAREQARRERVARQAETARAVRTAAGVVLEAIEGSLRSAAADRTAVETARADREAELSRLRVSARELSGQLDRLVDTVHRDALARAEQRMRVEALAAKASEEFGVAPDVLVTEYGPHLPVPVQPSFEAGAGDAGAQGGSPLVGGASGAPELVASPHGGGEPVTRPYVRAEQERRLRAAERALALLGRVNPLALEEFAALEERHAFLTNQLEDLRATKRDLLEIVRDVDARVQEVFAEAFEDTAREFAEVFSRLFPGGEGRLVLTEPDDMLSTGIEVEARPPGKKVKRLSLLSGGERSLTAVALLIAIFKARPSPFYVMDEVEAALDDTNLGRLLGILDELRETSQLIIVTHQKRTMEVADALYGASMRGDGITTVISQRIREREPVSA